QRSQVEKLELAKGLKLVRDVVDDSTLDGWLREARNGPFTPADKERYDQVAQRLDALTRPQLAGRVLSPDGANVFKAIGDKHLVDAVQFTQQTGDLPKEWDK